MSTSSSPSDRPPDGVIERGRRRWQRQAVDTAEPETNPIPAEEEVAELVAAREANRAAYRALLQRLRDDVAERPEDYLHALEHAEVDDLIHAGVPYLARTRPLEAADSFWQSLVQRRRRKQLGAVPEKYLGLTKDTDQAFAARVGLAGAPVLWEGPYADLRAQIRPGTVVKPLRASGAAGAFFVFSTDRIVAIASTEELGSIEEMAALAEEQLERWGGSAAQTWQVQELVLGPDGEPARDLKFYCFYGRVGMIVEITRFPQIGYAYFSGASLRPVRSGKKHLPPFPEGVETRVDRGGITEEMFRQVSQLSLALPIPFMRMDFHHGADRLVFCEFSSAPGQSDLLPKRFDRILGRMYHEAELRLTADLLDGKRFEHWRAFEHARRGTVED